MKKIASISRNDEGLFYLYTDSGDIHYTKAVIIAVDGGVIKPQKLKLEGAEKFEVSNLHYTVKSIHRFTDKIIMISGGEILLSTGLIHWSQLPKKYM